MEIKNSDSMIGDPFYNTFICKKLNGNVFDAFIKNARTDRYNIMCYINAYERKNESSSCDDGRNGGGCLLPTSSTTEALKYLCTTIHFIGCRITALEHIF